MWIFFAVSSDTLPILIRALTDLATIQISILKDPEEICFRSVVTLRSFSGFCSCGCFVNIWQLRCWQSCQASLLLPLPRSRGGMRTMYASGTAASGRLQQGRPWQGSSASGRLWQVHKSRMRLKVYLFVSRGRVLFLIHAQGSGEGCTNGKCFSTRSQCASLGS